MRDEAEVRKAFDVIGLQCVDSEGDNFRYGRFMGRLEALGWMLGQEKTGEFLVDEDYEGHCQESKYQVEEMMESIRVDLKRIDEEGLPIPKCRVCGKPNQSNVIECGICGVVFCSESCAEQHDCPGIDSDE